jgi:hypothetical protein
LLEHAGIPDAIDTLYVVSVFFPRVQIGSKVGGAPAAGWQRLRPSGKPPRGTLMHPSRTQWWTSGAAWGFRTNEDKQRAVKAALV